MKYVIVFPSMNEPSVGEYTMHYVKHGLNPWCLDSDFKLKNATVFDSLEEARGVERLIKDKYGSEIKTTIMEV